MTTTLPAPLLLDERPYASTVAIAVADEVWTATRVRPCALCGHPTDAWECVQCATAADAAAVRLEDR